MSAKTATVEKNSPANEPPTRSRSHSAKEHLISPGFSDFAPFQQAAGNLAVQNLLRSGAIQAKLSISQPGDPDEEEADRVAERIMRMPEPESAASCSACSAGGDPCPKCAEQSANQIHRKANGTAGPHQPSVASQVIGNLGAGHPLDKSTRAFFEPRLGADLSGVRIHTDGAAQQSARAIQAAAFTVDRDVVFGPNEYVPETRKGRELLAHELTHVVQQRSAGLAAERSDHSCASRASYRVRRQTADDPAALAAANDAKYAQTIREGGFPPLLIIGPVGGLKKLEKVAPLTYAASRTKLVEKHGEKAVVTAYDNDERIVTLARRSTEITKSLSAALDHFQATGQLAAYDYAYDRYKEYDFSYAKIFQQVAERGDGAIAILELFLTADTQTLVEEMHKGAEAVQAKVIADEAKKVEWREKGRKLVGTTVATRERILWFDKSIALTSVLEPTEGRETQAEAVTWGRLSGRACAVGLVEGRYYVYDSSDQFSHADVFSSGTPSLVKEKTTPSGLPLITTEGIVLTQSGSRFWGGSQEKSPETQAVGTGAVLGQTEQLDTDQAIKLFKLATLDLLLLSLKEAETRLNAVLLQVFPGTGFGRMMDVSKEYGQKVKQDAAALQAATTRVVNLLSKKGADKETSDDTPAEDFTEEEELQLMTDLETIGRINTQNPGAAMMVVNKRDPESKKPAEEGEIENRAAGRSDSDAAGDVAQEVKRRKENIEAVRAYFLKSPEDTLSLEPLHDQLLPNFTPHQQLQIRLARAGHTVSAIAKAIGLTAGELLFVIVGGVLGGPVGAALAAGATVTGATQAVEGVKEAKLTEAKSALDVPGGFQLATPQEAATAMRWAYIGVALTVMDVGALAGGGRALRLIGRGAARVTRGAGTLLIEGLYWARRTLGLPTDVVANLTLSGVRRLQSLSTELLERLSRLSDTLKRIVLGCTSPCRVDLAEIERFLNDPARKVSASTTPLTSIDEIVAALPPSGKFNRSAVRQYLKDHPSAVEFIKQAKISADDLSGLTALDVVSKGDLSEETARRTFSRYLTSLIPAKVGPDIGEFVRISEAAAKVEAGSAASALKGAMFENYARLYVTDFRTMNLGRRVYTDALIKDLEASRRTADAWVSQFGELWDFKNVTGAADPAQVRDYERILRYEARRGQPAVTTINYLFATKEGAEANAHLIGKPGFNVWYLGAAGQRVRLR